MNEKKNVRLRTLVKLSAQKPASSLYLLLPLNSDDCVFDLKNPFN